MTYLVTNPWITFSADLSRINYRLWVLLGEAASKCDHIAGVPLMPKVAESMYRLYLAKGVLATTAIEGNTLTEEDAIAHIEQRLVLPASQQYLANEMSNIVDACNKIKADIENSGDTPITVEKILAMNLDVLKGLPNEKEVVPGVFRQHSVMVGKHKGAPWAECPYLTNKLTEFLRDFPASEKEAKIFAILKAVFAHLYLVWIHPFGDGNGRTGRLLEFYILMNAGFPAPACHLLSNHYNKTRTEYYRYLEIASKKEDGIYDFIHYAVEGFVDGLIEQIEYIRVQQWQVSWVGYVHDLFVGKKSQADIRKRDLVLALPSDRPVLIEKIPALSPEMAVAYAGKTKRTIYRDLEKLASENLVEIKGGGARAKKENILAFLPWHK